jgi:TPR repeat protein
LSRVGVLSSHSPFAAIGTAVLLASCAAPTSYMGIDITQGAASTELRALASRAQFGEKQAQLELGIVFENGHGVPVDRQRARKLYSLAAAETGGSAWVWSPSVGPGAGKLIRIDLGRRQHGLAQAATRLKQLTITEKNQGNVVK